MNGDFGILMQFTHPAAIVFLQAFGIYVADAAVRSCSQCKTAAANCSLGFAVVCIPDDAGKCSGNRGPPRATITGGARGG